MKKVCLTLLLLSTICIHAVAQRVHSSRKPASAVEQIASSYSDSIAALNRFYATAGSDMPESTELSNPYYFPLLISPTMYDSSLSRVMGLGAGAPSADEAVASLGYISNALAAAYVAHPELFVATQSDFMSEKSLIKEGATDAASTVNMAEAVKTVVVPAPEIAEEVKIVPQKPNFWKFTGNYSLQFMQNYVTGNWYKGGESNYSMLAGLTLSAVYNNKQKVIFENTLELKLGFQSTRSDSIHKFKSTTDLIRLTNKLGLRATDHWYYTAMLQTWSQFTKGYKTNDRRVYSDILSPLQSVLSIGMNYKLEKKNVKLSVDIAPLALNFTYVGRPSLISTFGLDDGKHSEFDFGSSITATSAITLMKGVEWQSRLYAFTSYHKMQAEWENTFVFTINRYLSSKLFLYPRFDDSVTRTAGDSYFQFNEWLSLGLNVDF